MFRFASEILSSSIDPVFSNWVNYNQKSTGHKLFFEIQKALRASIFL